MRIKPTKNSTIYKELDELPELKLEVEHFRKTYPEDSYAESELANLREAFHRGWRTFFAMVDKPGAIEHYYPEQDHDTPAVVAFRKGYKQSKKACKQYPPGALLELAVDPEPDSELKLFSGEIAVDYSVTTESQIFTLPAGDYWIGDLCYVVKDNDWFHYVRADEYSYNVEGLFNRTSLAAEINGRAAVSVGTEHGDGEYNSNIDFNFCVDSGTLGAIGVGEHLDKEHAKLGVFRTFSEDFKIYRDYDGVVHIGDVLIETD